MMTIPYLHNIPISRKQSILWLFNSIIVAAITHPIHYFIQLIMHSTGITFNVTNHQVVTWLLHEHPFIRHYMFADSCCNWHIFIIPSRAPSSTYANSAPSTCTGTVKQSLIPWLFTGSSHIRHDVRRIIESDVISAGFVIGACLLTFIERWNDVRWFSFWNKVNSVYIN